MTNPITLLRKNSFLIGNSVGFQIIWWVLLIWEDQWAWTILPLLAAHFYFCPHKPKEFKSVALYAFTGLTLDSILTHFGFFVFKSEILLPIWLILLWTTFACSLNHSMYWVYKNWRYTLFIGAIGLPLSYLAAEKMGAVTFYPQDHFKFGLLFLHGITYVIITSALRKALHLNTTS